MDTTAAIILMTIFNVVFTGLVGGIIVHVIQRRIDATIQKTLFEYQARFTRDFSKTLEVLENLNNRFLNFRNLFNLFVLSYRPWGEDLEEETPNPELKSKIADIYTAMMEFSSYFKSNRLFLSYELINEVWDIDFRTSLFYDLAFGCYSRITNQSPTRLMATNAQIKEIGLEGLMMRYEEKIALKTHLLAINTRIIEQAERLEKLYRSVVGIK